MRDPADVTAAAGSGLEPLEPVVAQAMRESDAYACLVFLLAPGGRELHMALLTGISPRIVASWTRVPLTTPVPVADAVRERRLVWISGQEEMARRYPRSALVLPYPFAVACAPITTGTTDWGGLVVLWPGSHPPRLAPHERDAVYAACHRLGLLLRQAADDGHPTLPGPRPRVLPPPPAPARGSAEGTAAADFTERLPEGCCALDLEGRITFINSTAAELVGVRAPGLLGALPWQALPWLNDPAYEDRYRAAAISRQPTSFTALRPPDRWLSFHLYPDSSGISVLIAPAVPAHATDAPERQPPPMTATGGATALYHLMHLAAMLTEAVGVQDVVDRVNNQIVPAFGVQALTLMTEQEGRLRIIGHHGYTADLVSRFDAADPASDTPAAHVLATGVPSFFASFAELSRAYPPAVLQDGMAAWAFLPLIASGRAVGSLVLAYDQPHPFDPDERAVLTSIAGLIAQALDRARLYDAKYQLAHALQASLLPRALPHIPGLDVAARYLPATLGIDVGGDFYDLIRLDDGAAVTIGDVEGHNVQAAALMGQVRTAVLAASGASPGEVLARTNRLLTDLEPGLFTSCLYIRLDLAHHRALLSTAGHPPPLLRHPDGHTEVLDLTPGLLLGIDPTADYPTTDIPLPPGAVLALYTDGLVEAPGIDLDYATNDLADQLTRARGQTMDALADTLVHYAKQSAPRSDDIALLLINPR
ncbi:SpoIIE family protein phosphatase [Nonomuraea sp. NPDC046570]|uniref:SpoIIE family protein phosphatase n=1 Tax=Nonomuraea sp. NPDC046570 TaxID=3155255 RepID=UPI0033D051FF